MAFASDDSERTRSLKFNHPDVIFLDFSVNDYYVDPTGRFFYGSDEHLTEGVEVLIRKLFTMAPNSTLILLEYERLLNNEDDEPENYKYDNKE